VPHVARTGGRQAKAVGGSRRSGPCRALSGRRQDGNYLRDDSVSSRYAAQALRAKGAPADARIVPITWLRSIDPL